MSDTSPKRRYWPISKPTWTRCLPRSVGFRHPGSSKEATSLTATVYIDGLSEPRNPGTGTYGFTIYEGSKKIAEGEGLAGYGVTNNFSEYTALVEALKKLKQLGVKGDVTVRSDSRLLVGQMGLGWKAKRGGYLPKLKEAKELVSQLGSVKFEWIPREKNEEADLLSRVAYEKHKR
ncbi:MAG: ribonuclease HI family protein [Nitrososphaerales archaeon]|nr:ribonuclease HI family protein [Nitrososphaerales archaeon]